MLHNLKIKQCYLKPILEGKKTFEVRYNDRDFKVGDLIEFVTLDGENIPGKFEIRYILSEFEGLQPGYVVLAIK